MLDSVVNFHLNEPFSMCTLDDDKFLFICKNKLFISDDRLITEIKIPSSVVSLVNLNADTWKNIVILNELVYVHTKSTIFKLTINWVKMEVTLAEVYHQVPGSDMTIDSLFILSGRLHFGILFTLNGNHRIAYKSNTNGVVYEDSNYIWYPNRTYIRDDSRLNYYVAGPHTRGTLNREIRKYSFNSNQSMVFNIFHTYQEPVEAIQANDDFVIVATRSKLYLYDISNFYDTTTMPPPLTECMLPSVLSSNENLHLYAGGPNILIAYVNETARTCRAVAQYDIKFQAFKTPIITQLVDGNGALQSIPYLHTYNYYYGNKGLNISSDQGYITFGIQTELKQVYTLKTLSDKMKAIIVDEVNNFNQTFYEVEISGFRKRINKIDDFKNPTSTIKEIGIYNKETGKATWVRYATNLSDASDKKLYTVDDIKKFLFSMYTINASNKGEKTILEGIDTMQDNLTYFKGQLKLFDTKASFEKHVLTAWGYKSAAQNGKVLITDATNSILK